MVGLALSTFVHRSDQAIIQKKLGDFATKGKIRPSIVSSLNCSRYKFVNMYYVLYILCLFVSHL